MVRTPRPNGIVHLFRAMHQSRLLGKFLDASIPEVGAIEAISAIDKEMKMKPIHVAM